MSKLVISVIVPTHNRRDLVKEAIDSVLGQEPSVADLELVVVDDNSSDDTAEVVGRYPQAKYVRVKEGTPAGTRNAGIAHATGTWLAFLDDDDAWLPQKVKSFVRAMNESPDARVIFSAAYICDHLLRPGPIWPGPVHLSGDRLYDSVLSEAITPSVFMVHRDVFAKVGHFDPGVFRAEDRDLLARAARAGFRFARIPEALVLYRGRPQLDGDQLAITFETTMKVLEREFSTAHRNRPGWLRRRRIALHVRGWYAHQILQASRQERRHGRIAQASRLSRVALSISPVHWVRNQTWG